MSNDKENLNKEVKLPIEGILLILFGVFFMIIVFFSSITIGEFINGGKGILTYSSYILVAISILAGTIVICTIMIMNRISKTYELLIELLSKMKNHI